MYLTSHQITCSQMCNPYNKWLIVSTQFKFFFHVITTAYLRFCQYSLEEFRFTSLVCLWLVCIHWYFYTNPIENDTFNKYTRLQLQMFWTQAVLATRKILYTFVNKSLFHSPSFVHVNDNCNSGRKSVLFYLNSHWTFCYWNTN